MPLSFPAQRNVELGDGFHIGGTRLSDFNEMDRFFVHDCLVMFRTFFLSVLVVKSVVGILRFLLHLTTRFHRSRVLRSRSRRPCGRRWWWCGFYHGILRWESMRFPGSRFSIGSHRTACLAIASQRRGGCWRWARDCHPKHGGERLAGFPRLQEVSAERSGTGSFPTRLFRESPCEKSPPQLRGRHLRLPRSPPISAQMMQCLHEQSQCSGR